LIWCEEGRSTGDVEDLEVYTSIDCYPSIKFNRYLQDEISGGMLNRNLVFLVNSQQEFWSRELNGEIVPKDENFRQTLRELISNRVTPIVQIDEDLGELNFLKSLPKNSIIGWCPSDEAYKFKFNHELARIDSLALILRPYKLSWPSISNITKAVSYSAFNVKQTRNVAELLRMAAWQLRGFGVVIRQALILFDYKVNSRKFINIPIGYTNIFAKSFCSILNVENGASLLKFDMAVQVPPIQSRVSFMGQSGQIVREVAIRALEKENADFVVRRSGYGASNILEADVLKKGEEYIRNLMAAAFALCPPGNISGESFRLFETTVLKRLPIFLENVTSDPNFKCKFLCGSIYAKNSGWSKLIKGANSIDEQMYKNMVKRNLEISIGATLGLKNYLLEGDFTADFIWCE
jgi:hypothetical protein